LFVYVLRMIKNIIEKANITRRHFNYLVRGDRNATADTARNLEKATGIPKEIWVFGTGAQRKRAVKGYLKKQERGKK